MQSRDNRTFIAGEDLSSAQFKFVTLESDGQVDLADSAGENAIGVCIVGAGAGKAVTVTVSGSVMVTAGGTNVCTQILKKRLISFLIRVIKETNISPVTTYSSHFLCSFIPSCRETMEKVRAFACTLENPDCSISCTKPARSGNSEMLEPR